MILLILRGTKSQLTIRISTAQTITPFWQFYYGVKQVNGWIYRAIKYSRDYVYKMYPYDDLTQFKRFKSYNIEQQASIVADYWAVSASKPHVIA
jgi:hypothetical protein